MLKLAEPVRKVTPSISYALRCMSAPPRLTLTVSKLAQANEVVPLARIEHDPDGDARRKWSSGAGSAQAGDEAARTARAAMSASTSNLMLARP